MHADTALAALLSGLGTSLHCSVMCGPLACAFRTPPLAYHAGRVLSYTTLGGLFGLLGAWMLPRPTSTPLPFAPWILLGALLLMASGWERRLPVPAALSRALLRLKLQRNLGVLSPLLPCGPLWLLFATAGASASAREGALLLLCFSLGTIPLYALAQNGLFLLQNRLAPRQGLLLQRALLWAATALLAWRVFSPSPHGCCAL
ncbi:MAG: hypothetical protein RLZZ142_402 [Verrucomicrobiota bacterium]